MESENANGLFADFLILQRKRAAAQYAPQLFFIRPSVGFWSQRRKKDEKAN